MSEDKKKIYFRWLEEVRRSGKINMFGSAEPLAERFDLSKKEAREIVLEWMKSYDRKDYE